MNQLDDFCSRHDNIIALYVCLFINNCSSIGFVLVATRGGIRRGILHISRYYIKHQIYEHKICVKRCHFSDKIIFLLTFNKNLKKGWQHLTDAPSVVTIRWHLRHDYVFRYFWYYHLRFSHWTANASVVVVIFIILIVNIINNINDNNDDDDNNVIIIII